MAKLTEDMVMARTRVSDLSTVKKFNCWGGGLQDISLLRRMISLEVLSLSVNKISSLADIQYCKNLKELYVRKNEIKNLNEIYYLKNLTYLRALWLGENPCSENDNLYRYTVIKNLPNLEKLDDLEIEPEEKQDAFKKGRDLIHPEYCDYENNSPAQSPVRVSRSPPVSGRSSDQDYEDSNESRKSYSPEYEQQYHPQSDSRYSQVVDHHDDRNYKSSRRPSEIVYDQQHIPCNGMGSDIEKQIDPQCTSYLNRCNSDTSLALKKDRSLSDSNTKMIQKQNNQLDSEGEITTDNREGLCNCTTQYDRRSRENFARYRETGEGMRYSSSEGSGRTSPLKADRNQRFYDNYRIGERNSKTSPYLPRRPITRNSNLLSAVLCLIKELDYRSLEVVAVAVKCRMDEFDD